MRTQKNPPASSSDKLEIQIPGSWSQLTQNDFKAVCFILSQPALSAYAETLILFRILKMEFIASEDNGLTAVILRKGEIFRIRAIQIAWAMQELKFLHDPDAALFRNQSVAAWMEKLGVPDITRMPFGKFLSIDTLFSNAVMSQRDVDTHKFAVALMGKVRRRNRNRDIAAAVLWFQACKAYLAAKFTHLFSNTDSSSNLLGSPTSISDSVNAQIRALTKGDVSAEERILAVPAIRALTELNELAREYAEMKALTKP